MPVLSPREVNSCSLTGTYVALYSVHQTPVFPDRSVLQKYALYGLRFLAFPDREVIIPKKTVIIRSKTHLFTPENQRQQLAAFGRRKLSGGRYLPPGGFFFGSRAVGGP
ncbi:hypothetical protein Mboo_1618 [Methanoregula boonei 6A8]|uniref:Uncharacterized protein n=1 Tax=Methanoregula boonei (strain DSM 21154 / JCM 14090 / 6A8) TaxID=456442 RepID=A7I8S4_METB6|nr:hypothetical protein Mboo_1618 [Methanoregula boonei 6A8]